MIAKRKRHRPHPVDEGAAPADGSQAASAASPTAAQESEQQPGIAAASKRQRQQGGANGGGGSARVIPLVHSQRLRKHATLIHQHTRGFLLCCDRNRETECMTGTLTLLRAYADSMYGAEEEKQQTKEEDEEVKEASSHHIAPSAAQHCCLHAHCRPSAASASDVSVLPSSASRGRFSLVSVGGVEGLVFIACNRAELSPLDIVLALLADLRRSAPLKPVPQRLLRLLPVMHTAAAASIPELLSSLPSLLPPLSAPRSPPTVSFSVLFRHSNAANADRRGWIDALAGRVAEEGRQRGLQCVVRLSGSELTVLCWLVKSVAMIGVLPDYELWRQYHVQQQQQPQPQPAAQLENG